MSADGTKVQDIQTDTAEWLRSERNKRAALAAHYERAGDEEVAQLHRSVVARYDFALAAVSRPAEARGEPVAWEVCVIDRDGSTEYLRRSEVRELSGEFPSAEAASVAIVEHGTKGVSYATRPIDRTRPALPDDVRAAAERVRRNLCGDHSDFECTFGDHVVETRDLRTLLSHLQRTETQ